MTKMKPKLQRIEKRNLTDDIQNQELYCGLYDNDVIEDSVKFINGKIEECHFKGIDFKMITLKNLELIDVCFEDCDLSNKEFSTNAFTRVTFKRCKLLGINLSAMSLKNVYFENCNLRYSSMNQTKMHQCSFEDCDLNEAYLVEDKLISTELKECSLNKIELRKTSLNSMDISTCEVRGIHTDFESIRGAYIGEYQALDFISLLGLRLK